MRWESQTVTTDDAGRLPGVAEDVVIRRFDAPEALDMRFHEIRTKSALNRIPAISRVPFDWTVNPYRGCSHACVYCLAPDTPVLMADGRSRTIADLRVGDRIYGTVREGAYRRYVKTEVLAHWSTVKPAYRITLADGTELVASGDHRFLTRRGWKHVTGTEQGVDRRPHLTLNDELLGIGALTEAPSQDEDYRLGYLCGIIRGDGHIGSYAYPRPGRAADDVHRFRLALVDLEALRRARAFLNDFAVETGEFAYASAGAPMRAIRTQRRASVERVRALTAWPSDPSSAWRKGFLAGIFDADGSCSDSLRISNTDAEIIDQITAGLDHLGLPYRVEDRGLPNGLCGVRLLGGTVAHQRFFHAVDPAITRKRSLEGRAIKFAAGRLRVTSIEPLGLEMPMYDITTSTGDFIANGVVSHNCFARPTHEYLDLNAGRDFEREIVVKVNVPEVLRAELARPSWKGERVALGTNTDPYQWVEGRYKLMRGIWEAFRDFRNPCSVLTKSPLLLRDLDLMKEIAAVTEFSACLSIPTLDEKAWRATEPHTPNPKARLEAVAELNRNGIPTGVLIAPLMPGINDAPEQVERIVEGATEANATYIGGQTLFLRGSTRDVFFEWLREQRPELLERYERLYAKGAYLSSAERRKIEVGADAPWIRRDYPADEFRRGASRRRAAPSPPPAKVVVQETLF